MGRYVPTTRYYMQNHDAFKNTRWDKEVVLEGVLHRWHRQTNPIRGVGVRAVVIRDFKEAHYRWEVWDEERLIDTDRCSTLGRAQQEAHQAMRTEFARMVRVGRIPPLGHMHT